MFKKEGTIKEIFKTFDPILVQTFAKEESEVSKRYHFLFTYLLTGFLSYRSRYPSLIRYPGAPSRNGKHLDQMEGFTRMLPLLCSWIASGREKVIETLTGEKVELEEIVRSGLISGTDTNSPGYWGSITHRDQRICEAADVALSIWLVRDHLWLDLSPKQREKIMNWLLSVNGKKVWDSNWHLFPVIINVVANALGYRNDKMGMKLHYERCKSFYRGEGWFSDGPSDVIDYYNVWGFHYILFWLDKIDPHFDPEFIRGSLSQFLKSYIYFLSPEGFPILGRSICYRMAASVPLIAGHIQDPTMVDAGLAQRALDSLWGDFISKGAVAQGNVTQGYYKKDYRFLDNYSGPGSCLWALRSLVLSFFCPEGSPLWAATPNPLPIEMADYCITIPSIGWTVMGLKKTQEIIIETGRLFGSHGGIKNYTVFHKIAEFLFRRPFRPENHLVKYQLARYSSKEPFCGLHHKKELFKKGYLNFDKQLLL